VDLFHLVDRLVALPAQGLTSYEAGVAVRRPYPAVREEALRWGAWLDAAGGSAGMRVGILAENSYAWILAELALLSRRCVTVCLPPQEFAGAGLEEPASRYALDLLLVSEGERAGRGEAAPWIAVLRSAPGPTPELRRRGPEGPGEGPLASDVYSPVFSSGTSGKLKCLQMSPVPPPNPAEA